MKKLLIMFLTVVLAISLAACFHDEASSIGIIGGADGPTAVFVTPS